MDTMRRLQESKKLICLLYNEMAELEEKVTEKLHIFKNVYILTLKLYL